MSEGVRRDVRSPELTQGRLMRYDVVKIQKGKITKLIGSGMDLQVALSRIIMAVLHINR